MNSSNSAHDAAGSDSSDSTASSAGDQQDAAEGDAAAVRAGADVEVPADEPAATPHTTRTLSDVEKIGLDDENFPLTTDEQAQDEGSVVNPESS
jgi:hypothetical protein